MVISNFNLYSSIELFSVLSAFLINLTIYLKTKEIYELSQHIGIKYFRLGFLYFALSNYFTCLLLIFWYPFATHVSTWGYLILFAIPSIYFDFLGLFSLLYSLIWKKYKGRDYYIRNLLYILPIAIMIIIFIVKDVSLFIIAQTLIFLGILILSYMNYSRFRAKKGFPKLYSIYMLLFVSWIVDTFSFGSYISSPEYKILNKIISLCILLIIFYKVNNELSLNPKPH